jgi:NAD(P)-dependent dehydrogenase (short-subunit alcohol dehydrogenase family)
MDSLIPATMDADRVESFGGHTPFGRAAQPDEIAPSYVFFAAGQLSSYYSGEVLAPIGGEYLPGGREPRWHKVNACNVFGRSSCWW